ncbi:MAG TPA: calcium:proton antiporter [Actinotalea caeni]|uniref:calcium:proton antiporter n=1 Tax=Actinotalea caeni TaxID=1348467 RepID=UPI002B4AE32C|nr:calcium:proton antiporter [Actinotalea caeni]HLV54671.1 calcium:proton antiporter [Actinotalea caeni]
MRTASTTRTVVTPTVLARSGLGWGAVLATALARPLPAQPLPGPALVALLAVIVAVILVCAWGVVGEAEHLARRLGDPYGTLVLTLSIVAIEVILISAVMLGPGDHPTIARDSVTAVSMIILNLVVGVALVTAGARHPGRRANRAGVGAYLVLLAVLLAAGLALPGLVGRDGALSTWQAVMVALLTAATYVWFLVRQTGRRRRDFQEVTGPAGGAAGAPPAAPIGSTLRRHRAELGLRTLVLVLTVLPIVLLSHDMATLLDDGLARLGAPVALSGLLVAAIVFLPETITTIRAAAAGELQRVSNLCHGALLSTVGLTIPAVLVVGLLTGQPVVLAESPVTLALLGLSLLLTVVTVRARPASRRSGVPHLLLFAAYLVTVLA